MTDPAQGNGADPVPRFDGRELKSYRTARSMSRAQLARMSLLSTDSIKLLERNRIQPSEGAFTRICLALRISVAFGRENLCSPGPADHRPYEFATETNAANRAGAPPGNPRRRTRMMRLMTARRAKRDTP